MNLTDEKVEHGPYLARFADSAADLKAVQELRADVFRGDSAKDDADALDARCLHVMVEDTEAGVLLCAFRLLHVNALTSVHHSYSAQFYDLSALEAYHGDMLEVGRFCIRDELTDPHILRMAWSMITRYVDNNRIKLLFGCSSFEGTDPLPYKDAFAQLCIANLAPARWRPRRKAPFIYEYANALVGYTPDRKKARRGLPSLLRTYLTMGGWVSDHAVIDKDLKTLHVFTGVEIAAIPAVRKRLLRMDAA